MKNSTMVEESTLVIEFLDSITKDVIKEFPLKIEEYQNGKTGIVNMFMGEIKSRAKDKFEPRIANELLMKKLLEAVDRYRLGTGSNSPRILLANERIANN